MGTTSSVNLLNFTKPLEGCVVLVVNDSATSADKLRDKLTSWGATVHVASCIASAESVVSRCKPHVMISDGLLPPTLGAKPDKEKSIQWLKDTHQYLPGIKIGFYSGLDMRGETGMSFPQLKVDDGGLSLAKFFEQDFGKYKNQFSAARSPLPSKIGLGRSLKDGRDCR